MTAPRLRLTSPIPCEFDIHEACAQALDYLLLPPCQWACYPAGHIQLTPAQVARLARAGLKRAYPDILIFWQKVWGIELKRRGEQLSKTRIGRTRRGSPRLLVGQEDMFPRLFATGAFGAPIATCHSVDEVLTQLRRWNIPLRPTV